VVQKAQRCIRNYVWRSKFANPERAPAGWIQADLAEQSACNGGIGIPNLRVELMAMSAMVVGDWALTYSVQQQALGAILQTRDLGAAESIVPRAKQPAVGTKGSLWGTGETMDRVGLWTGRRRR
jgi:hypothetical protein